MKYIKVSVIIIVFVLFGFIVLTYISVSSTSNTFKTCEILEESILSDIDFKNHDSVLVSASTLYDSNSIKRIMQGQQYRNAWRTPVKFPIIYLDTLFGGSKVIKEGGGKQTHSLKIKDTSGLIYSLRSINKDPQKLIPESFRKLGLENIIVDGISAQHPYAAPVVSKLADAVNVLHTNPKICFLPKQKTLGNFNDKYGNRIFLLEHETEGGTNWTSFENVIGIMDTDDLQVLKKNFGKRLRINESALVRTRLFDILIGDWDRHAKQWGWIVRSENEDYIAEPLPGDRDNAFFKIEGIIPTILSNKRILPGLQSFEKNIDNLEGLVMPFDIYFLKNVEQDVFERQAVYLQKYMTDSAIHEAFDIWPKSIRMNDGPEIISAIKERRSNLVEIAFAYFDILKKKAVLSEPLKGSEETDLSENLLKCFDCD